MNCKNCKHPFGLDLENGIINEMVGKCVTCGTQLCMMCSYVPRFETREVIDPVGYIPDGILLCRFCTQGINRPLVSVA